MSSVKLTKSDSDRVIAGVCGGLGQYLGISANLVRLAFVLLIFASGTGIVLYLLLMVLIPRDDGADEELQRAIKISGQDDDPPAAKPAVDVTDRRRTAAAYGLIFLGVVFLLQQLGLFNGLWILPLIFIGVGVYMIWQYRQN